MAVVVCSAQQTDPSQYASRIALEIKPYLSDCTSLYSNGGGVFDQNGLAACKASQSEFSSKYYEALEGDQNDKFYLGFMFQNGDQSGVKYNATMACAWWIEMVDTGGRFPVNIFDDPLADACRSSPGAVNEARALLAEEQRISNLTY